MLVLLRETACLGEEDKLYLVLRANLKWQKDTYRNKPQVNNQQWFHVFVTLHSNIKQLLTFIEHSRIPDIIHISLPLLTI